tara:strand:- start:559 stop:672 length:114 start_codon:yes stop_codon:yes gene_type:complete
MILSLSERIDRILIPMLLARLAGFLHDYRSFCPTSLS